MSTGIQTPKTIGGWAIWLVILLAIIGCVYVACQAFGIMIPDFVIKLFWICLAAAGIVLAIRFLTSLGGSQV